MKMEHWAKIWDNLNINEQLVDACKLPLQQEAVDLVSAGVDIYDREQLMTPSTLTCWVAMRDAAAQEEIQLSLVSAFRSVDYQCQIIQTKLNKGLLIEDITRVSAIPGFSEHHTGRALDLTTNECKTLEEEFDQTPAFHWLTRHADAFQFSMPYPRNNRFNMIYEPWHWTCHEPAKLNPYTEDVQSK